MTNKTITYGIRNAPPPFSYAVNGKRQMLPKPTEVWMHDIRNSVLFAHVGRSFIVTAAVTAAAAAAPLRSKVALHELFK